MINTKKSQNTKADDESFEIQKKAKAIIDGVYDSKINTALVQKSVVQALLWDTQQAILLMEKWDFELFHFLPEALKRDSKIVLAAIKKYPHIYASLSHEMKHNEQVKQEAITLWIKKSESIISLIELVESDKKTQKKMRKFLAEKLEQKEDYFSDAMSHMLYELYVKDPDLYTTLIVKWLLQTSLSWVTIGSKLISFLTKQAKNLQAESSEEAQSILLQKIQVFLEIPNLEKYPLLLKLCEHIIQGMSIVKIIKQEDELDESIQGDDEDSQDDRDNQDYYSHWPYNVSEIGNVCSVWDAAWKSIVLEKSIFKSMSETSLENYMNFSIRMKELWLEFLITKQNRLSQLVTGVNFYQWEGMNEWRILKFLSSVGKNIGIPEESSEDADGNKKIWHFKTLWYAKMKFLEIQNATQLWGIDYRGVNRGGKSVVEVYMRDIEILGEPFWEISVSKWKK